MNWKKVTLYIVKGLITLVLLFVVFVFPGGWLMGLGNPFYYLVACLFNVAVGCVLYDLWPNAFDKVIDKVKGWFTHEND